METNARYFLVGLFVMMMGVAGIVFVLWIGKGELDAPQQYYEIQFQGAVTGLKDGAQVLYRGVPVGSVKKILLDGNDPNLIHVHIGIYQPVTIRENTTAILEMQGITGIAFIQLEGDSSESPVLQAKEGERYPVIHGQPSTLEELFASAPKLLQNLNTLATSLNALVDKKNRSEVSKILENTGKLTKNLDKQLEAIGPVLLETQKTLSEIKETAISYRDLAQDLGHKLSPVLTEAELFLSQNREPLNIFLTSGLYEFSSALAELRRTLASINRVTIDVERNPWDFLFGSSEEGYSLP